MKAEIIMKTGRRATYELESGSCLLRSHYLDDISYKPAIEEKLATNWAKTESEWRLEAGKEVIDLGASAFIPDFMIINNDGRKFYLEIIGFWTPGYLDERKKEFERAGFNNYLLAVSDDLCGSREKPLNLPPNIIAYKTALAPAAIRAAIEAVSQAASTQKGSAQD
jgi:predicted nuclease of restriction endonuclease-like RecB superfamily